MTNPAPADAANVRVGLAAGLLAYAIWGLFPLYLKQLPPTGAAEVVAHRILWSVPFGFAILIARRQWRDTRAAFGSLGTLRLLAVSSALIALNWLIYVWAVANSRVLEASLGYYINPLMFVAAGVFVLKETLSRLQLVAIALAAVGVLTLAIGAGVFPWVSIVLALTFTAYGFARKTINVGAMPGLFIETVLLAPFAVLFVGWLAGRGALSFGSLGLAHDALLAAAGPVTVLPLLFFAIAARRLKLSTLGFIQYVGPTGQMMLGLYYGETFTVWHGACFGLIWTALALVSVDAVRRSRLERRAALQKA